MNNILKINKKLFDFKYLLWYYKYNKGDWDCEGYLFI